MSFVPSTRECLQRLDRLRDTAQIAAALDRLNAEIWDEQQAQELIDASKRLAELHQLCLHMAANMSGGAGVPPTPPPAPIKLRVPAVSASAAAAVSQPNDCWARTPTPGGKAEPTAAPALKAAAEPPPDHYCIVAATKCLGISTSFFRKLVESGDLPKPDIGGGIGNKAWWRCDVIDAIARDRLASPARRGRKPRAAA